MLYYIKFVSWQNPRIEYASWKTLFSIREEAQKWADKWNKEANWLDDRRAIVEIWEEK